MLNCVVNTDYTLNCAKIYKKLFLCNNWMVIFAQFGSFFSFYRKFDVKNRSISFN